MFVCCFFYSYTSHLYRYIGTEASTRNSHMNWKDDPELLKQSVTLNWWDGDQETNGSCGTSWYASTLRYFINTCKAVTKSALQRWVFKNKFFLSVYVDVNILTFIPFLFKSFISSTSIFAMTQVPGQPRQTMSIWRLWHFSGLPSPPLHPGFFHLLRSDPVHFLVSLSYLLIQIGWLWCLLP